MSTNQTSKYGLNLWEPKDDFLRVEFNADNAKLEAALTAHDAAIAAAAEAAAHRVKLLDVTTTETCTQVELDVSHIDFEAWHHLELYSCIPSHAQNYSSRSYFYVNGEGSGVDTYNVPRTYDTLAAGSSSIVRLARNGGFLFLREESQQATKPSSTTSVESSNKTQQASFYLGNAAIQTLSLTLTPAGTNNWYLAGGRIVLWGVKW